MWPLPSNWKLPEAKNNLAIMYVLLGLNFLTMYRNQGWKWRFGTKRHSSSKADRRSKSTEKPGELPPKVNREVLLFTLLNSLGDIVMS
jgi:hypothetical protein